MPGLRLLKAAIPAVGLSLTLAPAAWGATFTVDNTSDADGQTCASVLAVDCSLRSAVTLSNAIPAVDDTIDFDPTIFDGVAANSTISVANTPGAIQITDQVTITGGDCDPSAGAKPCVGLDKVSGKQRAKKLPV